MTRRFRLRTVIGWIFCFSAGSIAAAQADEATDVWLGQRLGWRVNIDVDRDGHDGMLRRLSETIGVPIDIDQKSFQLLGITRCAGTSLQVGQRPAVELLEWIAWDIGRDDRITFVVTEDEEKRTPAGIRVLVVSRESLPKHSTILPPHDAAAAGRVMEERLSQSVELPEVEGKLAEHLARLSEAAGLPIELDSKSLDEGVTPNPSFTLSAGEKPALEQLAAMLRSASAETRLGCYLADDAKKRTPHEVRIVVAARSVLESNPARFTPPASRPLSTTAPEIGKLLDKSVTLQVKDLPLTEAVELLAKRSEVWINWDYDAVWNKEFDRNQRVTVESTDQPLGEVLQALLAAASTAEHPLVYTVWRVPTKGVKLMITSRAVAERNHWRLPEVYGQPAETK